MTRLDFTRRQKSSGSAPMSARRSRLPMLAKGFVLRTTWLTRYFLSRFDSQYSPHRVSATRISAA
jgi:hypothetical protein